MLEESVIRTVVYQTLAAVIFEICAFLPRPTASSGAVSGQRVDQRRRKETENDVALMTKTGVCATCTLPTR